MSQQHTGNRSRNGNGTGKEGNEDENGSLHRNRMDIDPQYPQHTSQNAIDRAAREGNTNPTWTHASMLFGGISSMALSLLSLPSRVVEQSDSQTVKPPTPYPASASLPPPPAAAAWRLFPFTC